jgi:FlaA1/EpsC-like NDP-sugar epimerase
MFGTGVVIQARRRLTVLPRLVKRLVLVAVDVSSLTLALWLAMSFRYGTPYRASGTTMILVLAAAPLIGILTYLWGGVYRQVTRYFDAGGSSKLAFCTTLSTLIWGVLLLFVQLPEFPRSVVLLYGGLGFVLIYGSRKAASWLLDGAATIIARPKLERAPVVIYGAGSTGVQLLEALRQNGTTECVGFLDATPSLWGQYVAGVKVYRPEKLGALIERANVASIYLAITDAERRQRSAVLKWLEHYPVRVQILPAMQDLAAGRVTVNALRPVEVDDLLGRDAAPPDAGLLSLNIAGKSVMVTGAGGSIGSELVRNILRQHPRRLVLFELSEVALYEIEMEVRELLDNADAAGSKAAAPQIIPVLGSVLDASLVDRTLRQYEIATIYHAAAYKHVPLVEANPVVGIFNNTFGTKVVAEAATRANVERMVLISSDKAVRPTNVMGASKRLAELILQAHASELAAATDGVAAELSDTTEAETVFTIVRFGNVLDSSGSVMRRFRKQIAADGPVTVTHPDIIRYFMSIPEAAELVIQAGALATGGEVFVLEMGEPVRIDDLARSMIHLSGLTVKDATNPEGDIAIEYTGLRPAEKLFEELLLSENAVETDHPRILRINDPFLSVAVINAELETLKIAMVKDDLVAVQAILMRMVEGYRPPSPTNIIPTAANLPWAPSRLLH